MIENPNPPSSLEVIRLGHPLLREVAESVPEEWFGSGRLQSLAAGLIHTMLCEEGVGLAAPQVAESLRLFAYWMPSSDDTEGIEPTILVNPEFRPTGEDMVEGWEGCLSIPGLRGVVPRHRRIKVKGRTVEGDPVSLTADDFHARVIQHEYDHLDGIVYLDRMISPQSLTFEDEWERFVLNGGDDEG